MPTNEDLFYAMIPGGIELQEKHGQRAMVHSEMLPSDMGDVTREQLSAIGFVFGDAVDDLFIQCTLPPGWKKAATSHSMWSDLLDEQGRTRGLVFYKAAFYDRKAHMSMMRRYSVNECVRVGDDYETHVMDGKTSIFRVGSRPMRSTNDYQVGENQRAEGYAWLGEHFPQWRDVLAYW